VNFITEVNYEFDVIGEKVACLDQPGAWSITPDNPLYDKFSWYFGDGQDRKVGGEVSHTFRYPGIYKVEILAFSSSDICLQEEIISFEVEVLEATGKIIGDTLICKSTDSFWYEALELVNVHKLEWTVEGGEILQRHENKVLVRWDDIEEGKVIAQPYSMNGCPGQTFQLDIAFLEIIKPNTPIGINHVGFNKANHRYAVEQVIDEREYEWFIEGGKITSVNVGHEIYVQWDTPDIIGILWYRESSRNSDKCAGISPHLLVKVNPELNLLLENLRYVHCSGDYSGEIFTKIEGGFSPYKVTWSHDSNINNTWANKLSTGKYDVKVIDAFGMEAELSNLTIGRTPELKAEIISLKSPSCHGREDGEVKVKIYGGIGPYSYHGNNATITDEEIYLYNLEAGDKIVTIRDYYGCETTVSFRLESPMPLLANIEVLKPSCPGETNGELMVTSSGGTSPYNYTWDYDFANGRILSGAPAGNYTVTVVDAAKCMVFSSGTLSEAAPIVRLPNGFRPAQGGINSIFREVSNCKIDFLLTIYNRWGELIHHSNEGWDGTLNGHETPEGMYTYVYKYLYTLEGVEYVKESRGTFRLIR